MTPIRRFLSITRLVALSTFITSLLFGCISQKQISSKEAKNAPTGIMNNLGEGAKFSFSVPYHERYPLELRSGPGPLFGRVELLVGTEEKTVSWAILKAMQRMQLSVIEPPIQLHTLLEPEKPWKTDIVPLDRSEIVEHNRHFPQMTLPTDRIYAIQYVGIYKIVGKEPPFKQEELPFRKRELLFKLESLLYQRGAASNYSKYPGNDYSGSFFSNVLRSKLRSVWKKLPGANPFDERAHYPHGPLVYLIHSWAVTGGVLCR